MHLVSGGCIHFPAVPTPPILDNTTTHQFVSCVKIYMALELQFLGVNLEARR